MVYFCPVNESLVYPWSDSGLNRCFVSVLTTGLSLVIFLIPAILQLIVYKKYGRVINREIKSKSIFGYIHLLLCLFIPLCVVFRNMFYTVIDVNEQFYGYMIFEVIVNLIMWPLMAILLHYEFNKYIIRLDGRRHGFLLILFWTLSFIFTYLSLISFNNPDWWWGLKT